MPRYPRANAKAQRPSSTKPKGALALAAAALVCALAGCSAFPYANQSVLALVTSVDGTTITAEVIDEASQPNGGTPGGAPGAATTYERQADEVFVVGDESVYATSGENLHPSTGSASETQAIRVEDGSLAEAPGGVSLQGTTLTIQDGGVYALTGTLDGAIELTAADEVRLVLEGFELTGAETPLVSSAGDLVLELGSGVNRIACESAAADPESVASAVDSQGALFVEGSGSLEIVAPGRALSAQTMLAQDGGSLDVKSGDDALFSASDLRISGGSLAAEAGDDVAHGDYVVVVEGGSVVGGGQEGIEAERIYLRGGTVELTTADDGVNAAEPEAHDDAGAPEGYSEAESCLVAIGGGTLAIDAKGDGIDSNGSVEIRGGTTTVSSLAPNSGEANAPLDYEASAVLAGGTLLMAGDGSMAQGFSEADQAYVLCRASGEAGQEVALVAGGETLASMTCDQAFDIVVATAPGLEDGEVVQVDMDGQATDATATTEAQSGMGMPGAGGQAPAQPPSGEGNGEGDQGATPPEPPLGDASGSSRQGTPPEPPSGEQPMGEAPQGEQGGAPDAGAAPERPAPTTTGETITFQVSAEQAETLEAGDVIRVTFGASDVAEELEVQGGAGALPALGASPAMGGRSAEFGTAATFVTDATPRPWSPTAITST